MNKDQVKGTVTDIKGKLQEAAGKATGDEDLEIKGLKNQAVGHAEKAIGDAKQGLQKISDAIQKAVKP